MNKPEETREYGYLLKLSKKEQEQLSTVAQENDLSQAQVIRLALREFFKRLPK